jgi:hypothetical protein
MRQHCASDRPMRGLYGAQLALDYDRSSLNPLPSGPAICPSYPNDWRDADRLALQAAGMLTRLFLLPVPYYLGSPHRGLGQRYLGLASGHVACGSAHDTIGVVLALVFALLTSDDCLARPTLLPALLYGLGTVVFPFFIMQPRRPGKLGSGPRGAVPAPRRPTAHGGLRRLGPARTRVTDPGRTG